MAMKEKDGVDAILFADGVELVDLKCFRGDREDVTEDDIRAQLHSAFMQKKMRRATVTADPPRPHVTAINVRELLPELAK